MSWYSNLFKRSKNEDIVNPCPIPDQDTTLPVALQQYKNRNVIKPMNIDAFFAAVNIVSNSIAMMPWLFKDDENNLLPKTHYLWHLFDNSELTRFNIMKNVMQDIILYGNGFMYIERDKETGRPYKLHYSPASQTTMYYNPLNNTVFYMNPVYSAKWDNGDNYIHLYINSKDGFVGLSINDGLITTNSTNPVVGTREQQMKNLRQSWDEARSSSNGTGTIFIPADLKFQQLSSSAKDSALVESRLYNVSEIGRWLQISPFLLGDLSHNAYGSLSESQMAFLLYTLNPYIIALEQEMNRKLIMPSRYGREHVDLDQNSILAIDKEKQANYLGNLVKSGLMTPNEARKVLGLPQTEDGNKLFVSFTDISQNTIAEVDEQ